MTFLIQKSRGLPCCVYASLSRGLSVPLREQRGRFCPDLQQEGCPDKRSQEQHNCSAVGRRCYNKRWVDSDKDQQIFRSTHILPSLFLTHL